MPKLSVVIPAYNESQRIAATLHSVDVFLSRQNYDSEIVVVNDGSSDSTAAAVRELQKSISRLRLIDNAQNRGKGWAVKQGMLESSGDIRLFMDADNSTQVSEIKNFLPFFEQGYDLVIGSRRVDGSNIAVHQPWLRDLQGGIFRALVHTFVPLQITDSQCGFKACTAAAAKKIFPAQHIYRWAFDVEILALARKYNFKIKELPVTWVNEAGSHVKLSGKIHMLLEVMEVRWNLWMGKYSS